MMKRFNDWVAVKISDVFSTMGCFWAFCVLALIPLVVPKLLPEVQFISSGFLQLVALPLLAVAAKINNDQAKQHQKDLALLHEKHDDLHETVKTLSRESNDGR